MLGVEHFCLVLKRNMFESTLGTLNYLVSPMKLMGFMHWDPMWWKTSVVSKKKIKYGNISFRNNSPLNITCPTLCKGTIMSYNVSLKYIKKFLGGL